MGGKGLRFSAKLASQEHGSRPANRKAERPPAGALKRSERNSTEDDPAEAGSRIKNDARGCL